VIAERRSVPAPALLEAAVTRAGGRLVVADLAALDAFGRPVARHDPDLLAATYRSVFEHEGEQRRAARGR
jgi:hypothetical protein